MTDRAEQAHSDALKRGSEEQDEQGRDPQPRDHEAGERAGDGGEQQEGQHADTGVDGGERVDGLESLWDVDDCGHKRGACEESISVFYFYFFGYISCRP